MRSETAKQEADSSAPPPGSVGGGRCEEIDNSGGAGRLIDPFPVIDEASKVQDGLDVDRLAAATGRLLQEKGGEAARAFLADWPSEGALRRTCPPSTVPALCWLQPSCQDGWAGASEVLMALKAASAQLAWRQTYIAEDFGAEFLERYGWTELIGERGPIASDRIAVGFLLLGPDVTYPLHGHDAEELYLPLSGAVDWLRGAEDWRREAAGARIFHPSRMPHAIRTGAAPLLALYVWRGGDLTQKSKIC